MFSSDQWVLYFPRRDSRLVREYNTYLTNNFTKKARSIEHDLNDKIKVDGGILFNS